MYTHQEAEDRSFVSPENFEGLPAHEIPASDESIPTGRIQDIFSVVEHQTVQRSCVTTEDLLMEIHEKKNPQKINCVQIIQKICTLRALKLKT